MSDLVLHPGESESSNERSGDGVGRALRKTGWQHWSYLSWNERLIAYYFETTDARMLRTPVERLPAAPEDLWEIAGRPVEGPNEVVEAFIRIVRERELPRGKKSFCAYCLEYEDWTPRCHSLPHFFGMLWFTCLVAYGYPEGRTVFLERVVQLLGRAENFQYGQPRKGGLPRLWLDFAEWTRRRNEVGEGIRILQLPPEDSRRSIIGYSHYLAFPNRIDRAQVARALEESNLVGFEPPVYPVLRALLKRRDRFSEEFGGDLDEFAQEVMRGGDPRSSAFWRAVRQEALEPYSPDRPVNEETAQTGLFFTMLDEGLTPFLACRAASPLPDGIIAAHIEDVADWPFYLVGADGDEEIAWRRAFAGGALVPLGTKKLLEQGILVLRATSSWLFEVATGSMVSGCHTAFVRRDRLEPFLRRFGGSHAPSIVSEWFEVNECRIEQVVQLPSDLEDVTQLLPTMEPPSVALIGGLRTSEGFYFVPGFLPFVRAPGAHSVAIRASDGDIFSCNRQADAHVDWALPASIRGPGDFVVLASWSSLLATTDVISSETISETPLRFVGHHVDDDYKRKPAGDLYMESCPFGEELVRGDVEVPLGITTAAPGESGDLLDYDSTARYLGPGIGQMSRGAERGFDWLVVGPKNVPEVLVFVGDSDAPTKPIELRSPDAGDRRLWRMALDARDKYVRIGSQYVPLREAADGIRAAHAAYRRHRVHVGAPSCEVTGLETSLQAGPTVVMPAPETETAADILAALSSRRRGLRYAEVRDVFALLLGDASPQLVRQALRGWTEGGLVDVLREPRTSHLVIVARQPRFVLVRRGFELDATVVGLLTSVRRMRLADEAKSLDLRPLELRCSHPWQPSTLRYRGTLEQIEELRRRVELAPSEWLAWTSDAASPPSLDARDVISHLNHGAPTDAYSVDAVWSWEDRFFCRGTTRALTGVALERRRHRDGSNIFVVLVDGVPHVWCHLQSWAVLVAHVLRGDPPFRLEGDSRIVSIGRYPVHLPLPLARLCVLVGDGMPGLDIGDWPSKVLRYVYPFGHRLFGFVSRLLPSEWLVIPAGSEQSHARSDR